MDLEEWELIPGDGFIDLNHDQGSGDSYQVKVLDADDFGFCSSDTPKPLRIIIPTNQVVQVPISWEPIIDKPEAKQSADVQPSETVSSQVCFKRREENEFADMKLESPKYKTSKNGFVHMKLESPKFNSKSKSGFADTSCFNFDGNGGGMASGDKTEESQDDQGGVRINKEKENSDDELGFDIHSTHGKLNLFKWSLTGIGAICSLGVAAATTFFVIFSGISNENRNQKKYHSNLGSSKRIEKLVEQATRLNEAMNRAQISYGGHYDGV